MRQESAYSFGVMPSAALTVRWRWKGLMPKASPRALREMGSSMVALDVAANGADVRGAGRRRRLAADQRRQARKPACSAGCGLFKKLNVLGAERAAMGTKAGNRRRSSSPHKRNGRPGRRLGRERLAIFSASLIFCAVAGGMAFVVMAFVVTSESSATSIALVVMWVLMEGV